jgi:hypothetical protein
MKKKKESQPTKTTAAPEGYVYVIDDGLEDEAATFLAPEIRLCPVVAETDDCYKVANDEGETSSIAKDRVALTREGALATLRSQLQEKKETLERKSQLLEAAFSGDCLVFFYDAEGEQEDDPVDL